MNKHIVVFSHGFGVKKDSRGMFTDIFASLASIQATLFDYNHVDDKANTLTVVPLTAQAEMLGQVLHEARANNHGAIIDLICHSQGCVVAGMLKPTGVRKILLLAPPATLSKERMMNTFASRPGAKQTKDGTWLFPRRDGSTTILPPEYWPSIERIDPVALYNDLAGRAEATIIHAGQDEILGTADFNNLSPRIKTLTLGGGHDFAGPARPKLIAAAKKEIEDV